MVRANCKPIKALEEIKGEKAPFITSESEDESDREMGQLKDDNGGGSDDQVVAG